MRWYRRHWYEVGLPIGIAAIVVAVAVDMQTLRRIVLLNFAVLLIHQFEEYGRPGGEPAIMNKVIKPSDVPDRYPLNQNNALAVNVFAAYPFYFLPVFFPHQVWLALAPVLFGFGQFFFHGIYTNVRFRALGAHELYNPGLGAVLLGHVPVGIWYIVHVYSTNAIHWWDWLAGIAYTAAFAFTTLLKMTYVWLADRDSPYPFEHEEMARFNVDARLHAGAHADASATWLGAVQASFPDAGAGDRRPGDIPERWRSRPATAVSRMVSGLSVPAVGLVGRGRPSRCARRFR